LDNQRHLLPQHVQAAMLPRGSGPALVEKRSECTIVCVRTPGFGGV
jgi:hypothetical protein